MKKVLLLSLLLICLLCTYAFAEDEPLFIAREGWKQGFINQAGEWVIQPEYTRVWPFTDTGYAAVESELAWSMFKLIDREGNIIADLPDWYLDTNEAINPELSENAVGSAFILSSGGDNHVLYLADTGKMIELNHEFLDYPLSPGSEENARNYPLGGSVEPWLYALIGWDNRLILAFNYIDYYKKSPLDSEDIRIEYTFCSGFVILDRQGNKLHEGCFDGWPNNMEDDSYPHLISGSYIITGDRSFEKKSLHNLIDQNGQVVLADLPSDSFWDEELQAVYIGNIYGDDEALLLNGERMKQDECIKRRAALNPCGLTIDGSGYTDSQGNRVAWTEDENSMITALSEFCSEGLAWILWGPREDYHRLVNTEGQTIADDIIPVQYNSPMFSGGWECVRPQGEDDKQFGYGYGYINPTGEMMYSGFPFDYADTFVNGLAYVQIMDKNYELLDAYINTNGQIVWAEYGKKDELQRRLNEGVKYTVSGMTREEAARLLIGEWKNPDFCGFFDEPIIFNEDGTMGDDYQWNLLETENIYSPFLFVLKGKESTETISLRFIDRNQFIIEDDDSIDIYYRVAPGFWEEYYDDSDEENEDEDL